jgi:hypothetical protein
MVLRGGATMSFTRHGMDVFNNILTSTPGRQIDATRSYSNTRLITGVGSDVAPVLFREKNRLGPASFPSAPSYPNTGLVTDGGGILDPDFKMPIVISWNFGMQRQITKDMVVEARYEGNRGTQFPNYFYANNNEYNIMENGLYDEFLKAQANLYANNAAGKGLTWAYTGTPGTSPLPIALGYLQGLKGADVNNPAKYTSSQFTLNSNMFEKHRPLPLSYGSLMNTQSYIANGLAAGFPANNLLTNPDKRGNPWIKSNGTKTLYDALVVEFRRRFAGGFLIQANYAYSRSYQMVSYSYRAPMIKTPSTYTTPNRMKINWLYELPFGRGKAVELGSKLDRIFGGWQFSGMARLQSGNPYLVSGVQLVGMTQHELQDAIGMRFDDVKAIAYWLPQDIINNSIAAFNTDVTQPSGYSSTYGVPTGRYIAPATSENCLEIYTGQKCSTGGFVLTGIPFARWDLSLIKRAKITERVEFELRAEFLNAFNSINFQANGRYGGQTNMGQVTASYRDVSTTNDPGGRICQFVARINF